MKTGTARQGMRVRIIGNHNSHGFKIGEIVILGGQSCHLVNNYGYSFLVLSELGAIFYVREIDMAPVGAKVV